MSKPKKNHKRRRKFQSVIEKEQSLLKRMMKIGEKQMQLLAIAGKLDLRLERTEEGKGQNNGQ